MNGLWGKKKSGIQPRPATVRVVSAPAPVARQPAPLPSRERTISRSTTRTSPSTPASSRTATPTRGESYNSTRLQPPHKRHAPRKASPNTRTIWDEDDSSEEDASAHNASSNKRQKIDNTAVDTKRRLWSKKAFSTEEKDRFALQIIHAADTTAVPRKTSAIPASATLDDITVKLRYPSAAQREKYDLEFGKDRINSTQEILDIVEIVADFYLTKEQAEPFKDQASGYIRQITKAKNNLHYGKKGGETVPRKILLNDFKQAIGEYNEAINELRKQGVLQKNLENKHHLPFKMIKLMLGQVYDRAVSPRVDLLKQYEHGTDNVYGELLPKLVAQVLHETGLKSDQVFVDLGSGVGNVTLQAALEFGSESWGCEMMDNACTLADAQKIEFAARCRLWGIAPGRVYLEKGDFLENQKIHAAMKRADVILVNNEVFLPALNQSLIDLFLDLKDGCQIVSLRPFVPPYHVTTDRNDNDPINNLKVIKMGEFAGAEYVSWSSKDTGGKYYITEKDSTRRFSRQGSREA